MKPPRRLYRVGACLPRLTNAWDTASRLADKHTIQGSLFVRLSSNGDKIVGAFCGVPFAREAVWTGETYESYDPSVHDTHPSLRVMLNFYDAYEGRMRVIENGKTWFQDVCMARDEYDFGAWLFEIERLGDAGDIKTRYSVTPHDEIHLELRGQIANAELHDLAELCASARSKGGDQ